MIRSLRTGSVCLAVTLALACSSPSTGGGAPAGANAISGPQGGVARLQAAAAAAQWTQTSWSAGNSFFSFYATSDHLFVRTWDALAGGRAFLTVNEGSTWTQIASAETDIDILSIAMPGGTILAGTWEGFYVSSSGGNAWSAASPSGIPTGTAIRSIATVGDTLLAGTTGRVYKSSDGGNTWTEVSSGLPASATVTSIAGSGNTLYAATDGSGAYVTTNGGASWTAFSSGLADLHVTQIALAGTRLFAVTLNGLFVSSTSGSGWAADSSGLANVDCLLVAGGQLFAGTDGGGAYASADGGATWTSFGSGLPSGARVWSLAATSNDLFAGTDSGIWRTPFAGSNSAPTVATAASASPNPVTGTTATLSVLGADDAGEANLTYTWSTIGATPAAVTFGANGTNAAKTTTATFSASGSYTFQVIIRDQGNLTATSAVTVTVIDGQPPSAPTGLTASSVGTSTATLCWSPSWDNVGVVGYDVYYGSTFAGSSATSCAEISNLLPGTTYGFTVRARDAAGNSSSPSAALSVTTRGGVDVTPPSAPTNLVWTNVDMTVTMSWVAATDDFGVVAYDFYYGEAYIGSTAATSATLIGFKTGTPYGFTVKARDAAGNVSVASNPITVLLGMKQDTTPPTTPTNLRATSVGATSIGLSWTACTDDVGVVIYQVFVGGTAAGASTTPSTAVSGLSPGTSYTITVRAYDAAGNASAASAPLVVSTTPGT